MCLQFTIEKHYLLLKTCNIYVNEMKFYYSSSGSSVSTSESSANCLMESAVI